jgi:MoxR-like ATPase
VVPDRWPFQVNVYNTSTGEFLFRPGPVFADLVLADEINRPPAKTQAALLEAMQEKQATVDGVTRRLPDAFTVFATQNPVEFKGTYPLPEAQADRFLFKILVDYPSAEDEAVILDRVESGLNISAHRKAITDATRTSGFVDSRSAHGFAKRIDAAIDSIQELLDEGHAVEPQDWQARPGAAVYGQAPANRLCDPRAVSTGVPAPHRAMVAAALRREHRGDREVHRDRSLRFVRAPGAVKHTLAPRPSLARTHQGADKIIQSCE